jgi:hypothetical protein
MMPNSCVLTSMRRAEVHDRDINSQVFQVTAMGVDVALRRKQLQPDFVSISQSA